MEPFLNEEAIRKSKARAALYTRLLAVLAALAAVLFVLLCLLTRTGNARVMLIVAMAAVTAAGWILICLWLFAAEPARAEARHLTGLAAAEKQIREGRISLTGGSFRIPKSVRVRKVRLETESEVLSLNVSEKRVRDLPPDGSLVRAETARKFITGIEVLKPGPGQAPEAKRSRVKAFFHGFGRFILPALLWAVLATVLTGFVFNQITDTAPENKIVIFADCEVQNAPELAEKLETALNGAVRMVIIHPFSYAMFDSVRLKQADLYLVPDSHADEYREWFLREEGLPAPAGDYFLYDGAETCRLYPGAASVHLEDGLARRAAELLISITDTAKEEDP